MVEVGRLLAANAAEGVDTSALAQIERRGFKRIPLSKGSLLRLFGFHGVLKLVGELSKMSV
jgi:hypothetical protein